MCTTDHLATMPVSNRAQAAAGLSRRQFARLGATGAIGALAACSAADEVAAAQSGAAGSSGLVETAVQFAAPGGTFDGVFIHPASGAHPAVIIWPDIAGVRPAKLAMGRRLAEAGYAVLVANPYYRSVSGQQFDDFEDWRSNDGFAAVRPWMAENTPENVMASAAAVVEWLDAQDAVDSARGIGNQGYCMTGGWTIMAAAAVPARIKAAASLHGGGLVGDADIVPAKLLASLPEDAGVMIAIARNDDANDPAAKDVLAQAGAASAASVSVEVYPGDHGWTVADSPVYDEAEAERAWANLLELYATTL